MFYRYFKLILPIFFSLFFVGFAFAQQTESKVNVASNFNKAIELYNNKAYAAAQLSILKIAKKETLSLNLKEDVFYYDAMCAIHLNQANAENKVLQFAEEYPTSIKKDNAFFTVGNYYFENRKASRALTWYQKINAESLNEDLKNELNFKMAYSLLAAKKFTNAKTKFENLFDNTTYGDDAKYYYGYITYQEENFGEAKKILSQLTQNKTYKSQVSYYLLDINFREGDFENSIKTGLNLLENTKEKDKNFSEISKIVGESYFNLGKYKESISHLVAYKGKDGKWNNTDYYQVGYAYFKQKDFSNALRYFNKIIDAKNNIAQNAYYNLGECYLNLDKKSEALNAFKSASEMDFDPKIKEDAFLNYAKLSYEEGNPYKSVAEVLQDFLKAYPKSNAYQEINSLVVSSYLFQEDYQGALDYLFKNSSTENSNIAKEVSYYRGIQLFEQNKYSESLAFFNEGKKSIKKEIKELSEFWNAESNYRLGNYQKALNGFETFANYNSKSEESEVIFYHIGYANFKLKNYGKSAISFQKFLSNEKIEIEMKNDAMLRLGDSYYANRDFGNAINAYKKVYEINESGSDYALFQSAMSYGLTQQNEQKIKSLENIVANFEQSSYKDDALFQLGVTFSTLKKYSEAHKAYQELIKNHPKNFFVPNALLRDGLLYYNESNNEKALKNFKSIVSNFPNSVEAKQALKNARNVYIDMGNVDDYASWVKTVSFANITDVDLDNTSYEAAEKKFLENNTTKAIEGFQKYISSFPNGLHSLKANFYLAQLHEKSNQSELSIPHYQYVISKDQSEFSEESLNKLSTIFLEKSDWEKAIPLLEQLEKEANFPRNKLFAQSNLMKGYYQKNELKKAINYAEKILQTSKIENQLEIDAKIIIARAAFIENDLKKASDFYTQVETKATGELKAEALYYSAFFKNLDKKYAESNKVIQKITSNYSAYKYWGAKSFVVMAKNYYAIENADPYQATYILENIIKNFPQFTDIVSEARAELTRIKSIEAKRNTSVNPQN